MKLFIYSILALIYVPLFGQRYHTADIFQKADSLIIAKVGDDVFRKHYELDSSSVFGHKNAFGRTKLKKLTSKRRTNKQIEFATVRYTFYVKKYEQPFVFTSVLFDKDLNLEKPIDISFIPYFILKDTGNGFLSKEAVLNLANSKFKKKGIKPIEVSLSYDYTRKFYIWTAINILQEWKGFNDEVSKQIEFLEVEAINGMVLDFYEALQAPLH